jgi:predicted RNA-binding protein with PIN domain
VGESLAPPDRFDEREGMPGHRTGRASARIDAVAAMREVPGMAERLVVLDGYNLVHRSPQLRPGPDRTLRESREKLVNLLSWMMGGEPARFLVVWDGAAAGGRDERSGRVEVRFSKPPEKADDLIRHIVEAEVPRGRVTVVTADLEVARHARAMGADVSLSDLFLASALGAAAAGGGEAPANAEPEKPAALSKAEVEEWARLFREQRTSRDSEE